MSDKEYVTPESTEFDRYLESIVTDPGFPEISPWKKSMNRILWGVGLTTLTLNFWNLDTILPGIGLIIALLGFRSLRKENAWFSLAYILTILRVVWFVICVFFHATVYAGEPEILNMLQLGSYGMLLPGFGVLLALRNGIRRVQIKAGLQPHGGTGLVIWYGILLILGLIRYTGIAAWGLLVAYFFMIRNLALMSKELDEAGYMIVPAPVKWSDLTLKLLYTACLVIVLLIGYCFCNHHPMDWQVWHPEEKESTEEIRQELMDLGFPQHILADMTNADIQTLEGADFVLVKQVDFDVDQNARIRTSEELKEHRGNGISEDQGQRQLRTTFIGVRFPGEPEQWTIIHHFAWLTERQFCGTEAIQMWPADQQVDAWRRISEFRGRVLYDHNKITYASDYHSLGETTYEATSIAVALTGQTTSTDVYATFSLPSEGKNQRGYVLYTVDALIDDYLISSWLNYVHQNHQIQFPVKSAKEFTMTSFLSGSTCFTTIRTALQFSTHTEVPELF